MDRSAKSENYHNLSPLMLFQTCMNSFLEGNIKGDILKNVGKQTVAGPHWLP